MPQKKQSDEQRVKDIEESDKLLDEQKFKPKGDNMADDDPDGMDEFWEERAKKAARRKG